MNKEITVNTGIKTSDVPLDENGEIDQEAFNKMMNAAIEKAILEKLGHKVN